MTEHNNENQFVVNNDSSRLPNKFLSWLLGTVCCVFGYFVMNLNRNVEELLLKVNTVEIRIEGYNSLAKRVELLEIRMNTNNATKAFMYDEDVELKLKNSK